MQAKLDAAERRRSEPIAIVGIGCRFPGGATDPEAFWRLLRDGVDAVRRGAGRPLGRRRRLRRPIAPTRRATMTLATAASSTTSTASTRAFFGISPREAASMDPQQRLLLEVGWEALEHAGDRAGLAWRARATGVFVGITTTDYAQLRPRRPTPRTLDAYFGDRQRAQRRGRPRCPTCSACAGRASPSTPPARRRWRPCTSPARACAPGECRPRAGRRRQPAAAARAVRRLLAVADAGARRPLQDLRRRAPTASCAARAAASSCSSGCPTRSPTATASSP